jgi:glutamyl-tRNA synthetase
MDWGNAFVRSKTVSPSGQVTSIEMELNLDGDFRKTKKKITWLAQPTPSHSLVHVTLLDYDYIITKKKLEEDDNLADFVTPVTEFSVEAWADANVNDLKKGETMQFERKGYFVFDGESGGKMEFIRIPDGKAASLASKAGAGANIAEPAGKGKNTSSGPPAKDTIAVSTKMYHVQKIYGDDVKPSVDTKMYNVKSVYDS